MGLKGYGLWVMGQLDSMCRAPPQQVLCQRLVVVQEGVVVAHRLGAEVHDVALQAAFERQTLKPVFHLIGYRLWV
jgi:hypothetical protein